MRLAATRIVILLCAALLASCAPRVQAPPVGGWAARFAEVPRVTWAGEDRFAIANLRNWSWTPEGPTRRVWETRQFDLADVHGLWFGVKPFNGQPLFAHTFLTFEFRRGGVPAFVTLSIEARRGEDEEYSAWRGLFGAYELYFSWLTERDKLTETVVHFDHRALVYPVDVTPDQTRRILRAFLERTNRVAARPERYHTVRSNCTSALAAVVNREFGAAIPEDASFLMTGRSAQTLHRLGWLAPADAPFAALEARADWTAAIRAHAQMPERRFSAALRRAAGHAPGGGG